MCKGLLGLILGHKMEPVYDADTEYRGAEEIAKITAAATQHNFWAIHREPKINPDDNKVKRFTRVYKGHVCLRCGYTVNQENLTKI